MRGHYSNCKDNAIGYHEELEKNNEKLGALIVHWKQSVKSRSS